MMHQEVKITKAEWDFRPQPPHLFVEGYVMVGCQEDEVVTEVADLPAKNRENLFIDVIVKTSGGPRRRQPVPFFLKKTTTGRENWKRVQAVRSVDSDVARITKVVWA